MFGSNLLERRSKPEQIADQAWEHLRDAFGSAGDTVRHTARDSARVARRTTSGLADTTGDRIGSVADEARRRAVRGYDALAGLRPGLPWGWLVGAGLIGVAVGWAAGSAVRAAADRAEEEPRAAERVEFVDVDRPVTSPVVG